MYWLAVCTLWYMYGALAAQELHCEPPGCLNITNPDWHWKNSYDFIVEGRAMEIQYWSIVDLLTINCKGSPVLESAAIPKFTNLVHLNRVFLKSCSLPDIPLLTIFERLNFTISQKNGSVVCFEETMPSETKVTEKHFEGIDNLSGLCINASSSQDPAEIYNIINKFDNLTALKLGRVYVDVNLIPHTLTELFISHTEIASLPQILKELRFLKQLSLIKVEVNNSLTLDTNNRKEDKDLTSNLEKLFLEDYKERHLSTMEYCNNLRELRIDTSEVESLPENWITACPLLEKISISQAKNLISIPEKLLKGATHLKELSILHINLRSVPGGLLDDAKALESLSVQFCKLKLLPDGFLKGAVNLRTVYLSNNELKTISSTALSGPRLIHLDLHNNDLDNRVLDVVATQTSLVSLHLSGNDQLTLECDENDKSRLNHLQHLRKIIVPESSCYLQHVCSDLRGRMMVLPRHVEINSAYIFQMGQGQI